MRDTIDMAREAGIDEPESDWMYWKAMERLVAFARADEREACAELCESWLGRYPAIEIMRAIRARGNT